MKWKSWKVMPDEMRTVVRGQLSVALQEGCPKELEGREDSWAWLCGHFQDSDYVILMETLDQTLRRRPGTYCRGMGNARRREPRAPPSSQSDSQVIALKAEVADLKTQMATQMASYNTQMPQLIESLSRSGIPLPSHFGSSSTSEPPQPEHGHHTSAPVDHAQTSEPHLQDDNIDVATFFN
ncbi:hypothetical protein ACE6H2_026128 [Prunus campanulata]